MGHDASDAKAGAYAPAADPLAGPHAAGGTSRRVLVVEDEVNIAEAIRFILQRDAWEVTLLSQGEGALEAITTQAPALVILDVMLPGVSGLEILRGLRRQPATAALPVILLTARGAAQMRDQAFEAGASAFIAKPFANAELIETARRLIGGETG